MTRARTIRTLRLALFGALAASLAAAPAAAKRKPVDSWGRAGVDFETYRQDALECALTAYNADVSQTEQAKAFKAASQQLDAVQNSSIWASGDIYTIATAAAQMEQIKQSIRPEKQFRELKQGMTEVLSRCLRMRGYEQFRLTEKQSKALSKLKKGSDERRHYLYMLASDPDVLEAQALPAQSA